MSTKQTALAISGIEITGEGRDYNPGTITLAITNDSTTAPKFSASVTGLTGKTITTASILSITNGGSGYTNNPANFTLSPSATDTAAITGSNGPPIVAAVAANPKVDAQFKATIVPLAIQDATNNNVYNVDKLDSVINEISNSLSEIMATLSIVKTTLLVITTVDSNTSTTLPAFVDYSEDNDKKVTIKITHNTIYKKLNDLNNKNDLVKDYIIYDMINKNYYTILKVIDESTNNFKIKINAVFVSDDIYQSGYVETDAIDTKVFKGTTNLQVTIPSANNPTKIASSDDFLVIMRKDINAYKSEYIVNREEVEKLDEKIGFNTSKIEHHKSLYDTQYNKNVFLNRQVISYNTIIGVIALMLVVINVLNVDRQLVKTISLGSLGVVLLLFVIYFVSNITYVEAFVSATSLLYKITKAYNETPLTATDPTTQKRTKIDTLSTEIDKLNSKFISYFEKIIITLPSTDSTDFYMEIKNVMTNDRDKKEYDNRLLEINRTQSTNDMDTIKYEIENNKLYIVVLLIASIVFISLYNIYINYISNDKYFTLMLFICVIILIVIVSYYIIKSNKRVRTVYRSIYWGPEHSSNF